MLHNDAVPWPELRSRILERKEWDGIVISPGPGTPLVPSDVGVCAPLLAEAAAVAVAGDGASPSSASAVFPPILGVCLGMQALAHACGGVVRPAPEPVHGRLSLIEHSGSSVLFAGVPREPREEEQEEQEKGEGEKEDKASLSLPPFRVVRYHSLAVEEGSLPACLRATAWTVGGTVAVETKSAKKASHVSSTSPSPPRSAPPPCPSPRVLMALEHASLPLFGVQFHPESVATSYGDALFANFRDLVAARAGVERVGRSVVGGSLPSTPGAATPGPPTPTPARASPAAPAPPSSSSSSPKSPFPCPGPSSTLELCWEKVEGCLESAGGTEGLFLRLFNSVEEEEEAAPTAATATAAAARSAPSSSPSSASLRLLDHGAPDVWWLDTATSDRGRFSFMGGGPSGGHAGPLWSRAVYRLGGGSKSGGGGTLSVTTRDGASSTSTSSSSALSSPSVFDALERQLLACAREPDRALPFDFQGGFVALLGYELKAECGGEAAHSAAASVGGIGGEGTATPDAAFYFADRMLAADHRTGDVYCLALYEQQQRRKTEEEEEEEATPSQEAKREAMSWVSRLCARVRSLAAAAAGGTSEPLPPPLASFSASQKQQQEQQQLQPFRVRRGKSTYLADVGSCLGALARGESYELCLTTRLERAGPPPPALALYRELRRGNPAPYSAFVALGGDAAAAGSGAPSSSSSSAAASVDGYCGPRVCCSSPERFLRGDARGRLEARPIKGTARRVLPQPGDDERAAAASAAADAAVAAALAASEKDRAENLMIVDLLRNDLGRVSEPGSVSVPGLMEVETFATVHQLVSTVVGVARGMGGGGEVGQEEVEGGSSKKKKMGWACAVAAAANKKAAKAAAAVEKSSSPPSSSPSSLLDPPTCNGKKSGQEAIREEESEVTSAVAAVRAAFPGGSMTGAPKVRSMAILDSLERGARGLYSGSLGFLSTTGAFDLNIVIRTAVVLPRAAAEAAADEAEKMAAAAAAAATATEDGPPPSSSSSAPSSPPPPRRRHRVLPPGISIGAGGAVVLQSTPEGEYEEMLLKASALLAAVSKVSGPSSSAAPAVEVED